MPESAIDFSDIARTRGKLKWSRPGMLIASENKQHITLRIDAEVLQFFQATDSRYQSRINAVLREYLSAHRKTA
jgi:uncharacterized protein (DUF4415 family)